MQILSREQIQAWDQYTIQKEPIRSVDLMERAASKCFEWLRQQQWQGYSFKIFCGKGNNGGDGLAIARMLLQAGFSTVVYILENGKPGSPDFQENLQRLHEITTDIHFIQSEDIFPTIRETDIIIDALFGSGLNKPLSGLAALLVEHLNATHAIMVSIDVPSGLFMDLSSKGLSIIIADHTLTFQVYKLGLLVQENAPYIGKVHLLDIGLHPGFLKDSIFHKELTEHSLVRSILKPRNEFSHKGNFGHALLIAGSYGKMGAAVLATRACMRSGAGLTTVFVPRCGYSILQSTAPEAMVMTDEKEEHLSSLPGELDKYAAIGIGPGIGTEESTQKIVSFITRRYTRPLVIDADALNILSQHKDLLSHIPADSILTPHPKEFDRLFGDHANDFERINTASIKASELKCIVVLKGHHTIVATPGGQIFFNSTGNAGMAKGGSGDVLTGILTALKAQGYESEQAAILGVYIHGLAGDLAASKLSMESMLASDIIEALSIAFPQIY
ncbi:MAG TPA: NAD(P)H-hydrate dehydratase [Flavisolibacter sp.]|nr:NAD(P)H-hydrate dehydratase [Flavisolibacter sp.]